MHVMLNSIDGFHVTSNDDIFDLIFLKFDHMLARKKMRRWVEIGLKGRKYTVF